MRRYGFLLTAGLMAAGGAGRAPAHGEDAAVPIPWHESFREGKLGGGWTVDAAPGNTVDVKDGVLRIKAAANSWGRSSSARNELAMRELSNSSPIRIALQLRKDAASSKSAKVSCRWLS